MTETSQPSKRQRNVDRFMRAANIGSVAVVILPVGLALADMFLMDFNEGDALLMPGLMMLALLIAVLCETYAVFAMFFRRNVDEFTQAVWHSGTTWAFFAAIVWLLLGIWVEAAFLGVDVSSALEAHEAAQAQGLDVGEFDPPKQADSVIERFSVHVILLAFFAGCQIKRLKGGF
ncbi:MAG: hypothetical protein AAF291_04155 [Pseudomonadota bacterium]